MTNRLREGLRLEQKVSQLMGKPEGLPSCRLTSRSISGVLKQHKLTHAFSRQHAKQGVAVKDQHRTRFAFAKDFDGHLEQGIGCDSREIPPHGAGNIATWPLGCKASGNVSPRKHANNLRAGHYRKIMLATLHQDVSCSFQRCATLNGPKL